MLVGTRRVHRAGADRGRRRRRARGRVRARLRAHECLTGEPPFDRDSELAVLYAHLNEPPPRRRRRRAPAALDDVVARRSRRRPANRPQTCGELARAARAALRGERAPRRRRGSRWRRRPCAVAAAVAAAAVLVGRGRTTRPRGAGLRVGADALAAFDARAAAWCAGSACRRGRTTRSSPAARCGCCSPAARASPAWTPGPARRGGRWRCRSRPAGSPRAATGCGWPRRPGARVALVGARSGRVERTLRVRRGAEHAGPLAVGSGSLWLGRGPEVLRVDPRSGRVLARARTPVGRDDRARRGRRRLGGQLAGGERREDRSARPGASSPAAGSTAGSPTSRSAAASRGWAWCPTTSCSSWARTTSPSPAASAPRPGRSGWRGTATGCGCRRAPGARCVGAAATTAPRCGSTPSRSRSPRAAGGCGR